MQTAVVLLVLAVGVLHDQVARAAPPNTKSRTIVFISPQWPVFLPVPPPAHDGPQSRSPLQYEPHGGAVNMAIPVSILVFDPSRSVASTIQGYVTQATGFVTSSFSSAASNFLPQLPLTLNIPDLFTGVADRVQAASTAVQTAWQNRPGNNPTAVDPLPDRLPNPEDELII